jgi:tRNA 2-selenouridine synthase
LSNNNISSENLKSIFLSDTPLIDVRAPVEFHQGSLPGAVNLPILNDEERTIIGTIYKNEGQAAAVHRGYELISGSVKEDRLNNWKKFISLNPQTVIYCFRGGKRSQITQHWLEEIGVQRPLIVGGYKRVRQFFIDELNNFSAANEMLVLTGPTGSGKTHFIHQVQSQYPSVDLEGIARHRGSAFGAMDVAQPSQIDFENQLVVKIMKLQDQDQKKLPFLIEDESQLIGKVHLPANFFGCLRKSKVVWLNEPLEIRVENIFKDYILDTAIGVGQNNEQVQSDALRVFDKYKKSLLSIQRKLGGLRTQEVLNDLEKAQADFQSKNEVHSNKVWIEKLLRYYYDPMYLNSLARRQVDVAFKGSTSEALDYLKSIARK